MQVTVGFLNGNGQWVAVQEGVNVLPTAGGGGGVSVESVNGQTGVVVLDAASVGALADSYVPTWASVTGKPATFAPTIGTTATTAKAGNAVQTATQTTATAIAPGTATNVQGILAELAARIAALEAA